MSGVKYRASELTLGPDDALFLYTDGVTEATDLSEAFYGEELLREVLNRNGNVRPTNLLPAVKDDIDRFVGEAPQFDDITMVGLRMTP